MVVLVRTTEGLGQSTSTDGGRTWSPGALYLAGENVANKRFFLRRLISGALLLVRNNGLTKARSHLTAFVSDDDGKSWSGGLLLDERVGVSYPDGVQAEDGTIYIVHDYDRAGEGVIYMVTFREQDVRAGKPVTDAVRLGVEISRLRGPRAQGNARRRFQPARVGPEREDRRDRMAMSGRAWFACS